MMKLTRSDTSVGAFLLVAIAAVGGFIVAKAQSQGWLRGTKRFHFTAGDGRNLKEQAPVRMHGIEVGLVENIAMDRDARIRVRFRVDPQFGQTIREDAQVTITEPPVLGLTYVEIKTPGSAGRAEMETGEEIRFEPAPTLFASVEGSVARVESIVKKVDEALDSVKTSLAAVAKITTDIAEGEGTAARLIKDPEMAKSIKKTLASASVIVEDLTDTTGALRRREGALGRLISDPTLVIESEKLLAKARESLSNLDEVTKKLTDSVQQVANRLDQAGASVEGVKAVVDNTARLTGELADVTAKINQGQGSVGKLLTDDSVFLEAKGLLKELRESVQDLREQAPINSFIGVVFSAF